MAKEKYLTEEELVNILYNDDDSGDELIPELEDSQSESEDELPLPEIDTPIPCDVNLPKTSIRSQVAAVGYINTEDSKFRHQWKHQRATMKSAFIFFMFTGLAFGATIPTRNLQDDLNDFLALIDTDKIVSIALDYLANDAEVQEAMAYIQSDEFHALVSTVESQTEFKNFIDFVNDHGVDASNIVEVFNGIIGLDASRSARRGTGVNGLIDDIIAILPVDDLKALFDEKLETSEDFKAFYDLIRGDEFQGLLQKLRDMPAYQEVLEKLRGYGVDVDHYISLARALFGVPDDVGTAPTRTLEDDLNDFLALIDVDQIISIALDYLANDAEVQEAMAYIQSDEFHALVSTVESQPEFQNFIDFVNDHGVDASNIVDVFNSIIGLDGSRSARRGTGVNGLIDDIIAILPVDDLKALFDEKLETSEDFKAFYDLIRGDEFQGLLQKLRDMPAYQEVLEKLRGYGVDVDHYISLARALFGVPDDVGTAPTRTLEDDLNDFLALIDVDQIISIALDYLANDAEVQEAMAYIQSDEFHALVSTVESQPEFQNFIDFVNDHGVDASNIVDVFNSIIGLDGSRSARRGTGVNGLIDDIIAILPVDDLKALFDEKLETSEDFKAFYDLIRGDEFQGLLQKLRDMPAYQDVLDKLRGYGVDVDHYISLARALFGVPDDVGTAPTRTLEDDLNDFLALIDVDQIISIALDYLANDAEVQEAMAYIQSDEFHALVSTVESQPEFKNFIDFVNDHGVDASNIVEVFNGIIGLDGSRSARRGTGVNGLIDDIIAILPVDDLKALFDEKLETSEDFKAFYDLIRGDEFQGLLQKLRDMPAYQDVLDKLRGYGVDVDHYISLARALFGVPDDDGTAPTRTLEDDLNDFLALIDVDQIISIALDYLANDAEVQEAMAYIQSDEFHVLVSTVESQPEFKNFIDFVNDHGVDASNIVEVFNGIIGLDGSRSARRGTGVNGLIDDIIAILPVDDLKALFDEKLETSEDFKAFYDLIRGDEFQGLLQKLRDMPAYQDVLDKLRGYGVDVDHYISLARALFGVPDDVGTAPTRNLQDDLNDFLALLDLDQILSIALDYLANDAEVQEALAYLQSDEFHEIITTLESQAEFTNFINFVKEHGLDVTDFINTIHSLIGLDPYGGARSARRGTGLNGLIDDIIAVLPIDELKALFDEKLETSEDFKALYDAIRGDEFQGLIQKLRDLPAYQELLDKLKDYGVDVDYYIGIIRSLFEYHMLSSKKNINEDLNDFIALVDTDKIAAILLDYLANDAEVQAAMTYLQSDEFHAIVTNIESQPEFKNFIDFVKEHGVYAVDFINEIHTAIGLDPYVGSRSTRRGTGINGLIDDIIAILPIDDLKALFQEKLENSEDFKALYDLIRGDEFQGLLQKLRDMPAYQELLDKLRGYGVDVDHYISLARALFGIPDDVGK
ncbi:hypothetical protein L9F63_002004 [Diploptera punctata]|uniref:Uncharacterized protein n=1 Tax=Diploptera punctata TaxID=6984 RepID=A0AAD8A4P6_DIPPU|nr:hypothetical protein L9F63_002004 [Diploptera punctata]